jgi:transposase
MTRTRGRGPRGKRIVGKTPHGHWKVLSTIAAMTTCGMLTGCTFDAAIDGEMFLAFVEHMLVPQLRPGQVVVLDNLPAHKSPRIDRLIAAAGARVVRLPPYSPDFNPIEMAISKIKALLRKLARRTVSEVIQAIGQAMALITADDALNFIRHCGYAATTK